MNVQVITLPEAIERQSKIKNNFNNHNIKFDFKSGIKLNECVFVEENAKHFVLFGDIKMEINENLLLKNTNRNWIRFGEIAAYIAHYKLWKEFLNSNNETVIICEDDASPQSDLLFLNSFDYSNIDFLNLQNVTAHNQPKISLYREPFVKVSNKLVEYKTQLPILCEGLAAYLITKSGANKLCSYIESNGYVGPNDCMITKLCQNGILNIHAPLEVEKCFGLDAETYETSYTHSGTFKIFKQFNQMILQVKN